MSKLLQLPPKRFLGLDDSGEYNLEDYSWNGSLISVRDDYPIFWTPYVCADYNSLSLDDFLDDADLIINPIAFNRSPLGYLVRPCNAIMVDTLGMLVFKDLLTDIWDKLTKANVLIMALPISQGSEVGPISGSCPFKFSQATIDNFTWTSFIGSGTLHINPEVNNWTGGNIFYLHIMSDLLFLIDSSPTTFNFTGPFNDYSLVDRLVHRCDTLFSYLIDFVNKTVPMYNNVYYYTLYQGVTDLTIIQAAHPGVFGSAPTSSQLTVNANYESDLSSFYSKIPLYGSYFKYNTPYLVNYFNPTGIEDAIIATQDFHYDDFIGEVGEVLIKKISEFFGL